MSIPPFLGGAPPGPPGPPPGGGPGGGLTPAAPFLALPRHLFLPDLVRATGTPQKRRQRKKPPKIEEILSLAHELEEFWKPRDHRMDRDYELYRMAQAEAHDGTDELIVRNTAYVTVEKVASMLGAQIPNQDVIPPHDSIRKIAQKQENLLRWLWEDWSLKWQRQLHGWLQRDLAHFACLRGWIAARVTYDPEAPQGENPIVLYPVDPRYIYPRLGSRGITAVIHRYRATYHEILDDWPEVRRKIKDPGPNERLDVIAYYDDTYHAVIVDNEWIKKPTEHNYGFLPWAIATTNGAPIRASNLYGKTDTQDWVADVGPSIFHGARHAIRQINRILTQLANSIAESANPALAVYLNPERREKPEELVLEPGAVNYLWTDERVEPIRKSPLPSDVQPVLEILLRDIEQATIPPVLFGAAGADQSGFAIALLSGAAKDATAGVIRALEQIYTDINERALTLLRDLHRGEIGYVVLDRRGNWIGGETITSEEIQLVGVKTKVRFRDITPKDRMQLAQLGIALVKEQLISPETARDEYLGIEDPAREHERVVNSLIYQDEEIVKELLVPLSLYRNDPELFTLWATMMVNKIWQALEQQRKQEQAQMGPPDAPPGGPSVPGLAGIPPMPGMPPTPAPAQFGAAPFDPMMHAGASAAGGVGLQAPPGVPQAPIPQPPLSP